MGITDGTEAAAHNGGISYSLHAIEEQQGKVASFIERLTDGITDADIAELEPKDRLRLARDMMSQFSYMEQTKISLHKQTTLSKEVADLKEIVQKVPRDIILKYGISPTNSVTDG